MTAALAVIRQEPGFLFQNLKFDICHAGSFSIERDLEAILVHVHYSSFMSLANRLYVDLRNLDSWLIEENSEPVWARLNLRRLHRVAASERG